jgi:tRNA modification GTPase
MPTGPAESGQTIFALASGPLPAAIAIVRLSGPAARPALAALAGDLPEPRRASLRELRDPETGTTLDRGLVLVFPGPDSVTGEDVGELHLHGGRAVVAGVLKALAGLGLRPAEPGEFSRRAFVNGRIDLIEAEGLADLIAADTERQRDQALGQMGGALSALCEGWRDRLVRMRSLIEAEIDFGEDEEIGTAAGAALAEAAALAGELDRHLARARRGERIRDGLEVVLTGPPNVGKSSLLNRLAGRDVAIVTAEPGTTRDLVEVRLDLGGIAVNVIDTAGRREVESLAEREGIRRGAARAAQADLVLEIVDLTEPAAPESAERVGSVPVWRIGNKLDLIDSAPERSLESRYDSVLSAETGAGLDGLLRRLDRWAADQGGRGDDALFSRERHRIGL